MTSGIYWCTAKYTSNRPLAGYAGSLLVIASDPSLYASQIFITDSGRYFFRPRKNGTWEAWIELAPKNDFSETNLTLSLSKAKDYQTFFRDMYGYYLVRSGNVVHFHANAYIDDGLAVNRDYTVFTIPGSIQPPRGIRDIFVTSSGAKFLIKIIDDNINIAPIESGAGLCEINLVWVIR